MNFKNVDEGIDYILNRFNKDELKTLIECTPSDIHFSLGIWVKNEIIYNKDCNMAELIINREKNSNPQFKTEEFPTPQHYEELTHIVIEELISKLDSNNI